MQIEIISRNQGSCDGQTIQTEAYQIHFLLEHFELVNIIDTIRSTLSLTEKYNYD